MCIPTQLSYHIKWLFFFEVDWVLLLVWFIYSKVLCTFIFYNTSSTYFFYSLVAIKSNIHLLQNLQEFIYLGSYCSIIIVKIPNNYLIIVKTLIAKQKSNYLTLIPKIIAIFDWEFLNTDPLLVPIKMLHYH